MTLSRLLISIVLICTLSLETKSLNPETKIYHVRSKIVTPDNSLPAAPQSASGGAPSAPINPPAAPAGAGTPSAPASSGSTPSAGASLPSGSSSSGSPPSGSAPNGPPPNGSSPPSGGPPSGAPPPMMGNIVADPNLPTKQFPSDYNDSESVSISAENIDSVVFMFDNKCDMQSSRFERRLLRPITTGGETPTVMIYNGEDSNEKEFPHMAALGYGDPNSKQWLCGGSLITENFVLTAAHCLSAPPLGDVLYVRLGNVRLDQDSANTQLLNVIRRIPHDQYDSVSKYNDIALLQLDRMAQITDYVTPICLFSSTNYEDINLIATGWGKTTADTASLTLHKVGLELFTLQECQNTYKMVSKEQLPLGIQDSIQICAGSHSQSKDTCQGDSGGPLQIRKNNRWYLIGVTSVGLKCGTINAPGIYTRVARYLHWIQTYVFDK